MKYNDDTKLEVIKTCRDYYQLSNALSLDCLKDIDNKLKHYLNYLKENDDINAYKEEYGNKSIVDWYEGLIDTKDFINQF